jgi:hypothetical protein
VLSVWFVSVCVPPICSFCAIKGWTDSDVMRRRTVQITKEVMRRKTYGYDLFEVELEEFSESPNIIILVKPNSNNLIFISFDDSLH